MSSWINFDALWKIVVVGLLAGAGLPALFALGLRLLSLPGGGTAASLPAADDRIYRGNPTGAAAAGLCFAVVLAAVGWGISSIVST
jgi:hypothetical protein